MSWDTTRLAVYIYLSEKRGRESQLFEEPLGLGETAGLEWTRRVLVNPLWSNRWVLIKPLGFG
jgi:hypothetical protein